MILISTPLDMISYPPLEDKRDGRTVGDRFSLNAVGNMALSYQNALMIHNHLRGIHPGRQVDNIIIPANMEHREPFIIANISIVAMLPLFIIVCTVVFVLAVVRIRQWRKQKFQLECLARVYDALEDVSRAHVEVNSVDNICHSQELNSSRMYHAIALCPDDKTPFFQPAFRVHSLKFDRLLRPKTACDVISHFSGRAFQQNECN